MIGARGLACLLPFVLAACANRAPVPEDRFYQVQVDAPSPVASAPRFEGGLLVDYVSADPLRRGRAVLYRDVAKPLELQRYHYEFWVDQPPRMVHQALLGYLRQSGVADTVLDAGQRADAQHRLQLRLLRFERLLGDRAPQVEVELQATLFAEPAGTVLWTSVYRQLQNNSGQGMHATALAMQKALEQIFRTMLADFTALEPTP